MFYDTQTDDALIVLEQHWPYENAVVPIPFPPAKMAPVSGVYVCLMYRMLDDAIAERLAAPEETAQGARLSRAAPVTSVENVRGRLAISVDLPRR